MARASAMEVALAVRKTRTRINKGIAKKQASQMTVKLLFSKGYIFLKNLKKVLTFE